MQTKITNVAQYNPSTLNVNVDFLDGETVVLSKTYPLQVDQDISTLYPQFKEDLNSCEAAKVKLAELQAGIDAPIDLSGVKSTSEIQAEVESQVKAEQEQVVESPASPTEPLA